MTVDEFLDMKDEKVRVEMKLDMVRLEHEWQSRTKNNVDLSKIIQLFLKKQIPAEDGQILNIEKNDDTPGE